MTNTINGLRLRQRHDHGEVEDSIFVPVPDTWCVKELMKIMLYTLDLFPFLQLIICVANPAADHADCSAAISLVPFRNMTSLSVSLIRRFLSYNVLLFKPICPAEP